MSLVKKIALASLMGAVGLVIYRFGRIVARVLSAESAAKTRAHKHG